MLQRISGLVYKEDGVYYLDENKQWVHENDADFTDSVLMLFHDVLYFSIWRYKDRYQYTEGGFARADITGIRLAGDLPEFQVSGAWLNETTSTLRWRNVKEFQDRINRTFFCE
jgi:hypothetical protein